MLSEESLPCPISDVITLSCLSVVVDRVDPAFVFPTQLTYLWLTVKKDPFNATLLTPLTRLQELCISTRKDNEPLDLSGLTRLTMLYAPDAPVLRHPTSLVECKVRPLPDTDLSSLTNLTGLTVLLGQNARLTFPTGLKKLDIDKGPLGDSNIDDVDLSSFYAYENNHISRKIKEKTERR